MHTLSGTNIAKMTAVEAQKAAGVAAAALYSGVAILMNFANKYTLQIFPLPNVILVLQASFHDAAVAMPKICNVAQLPLELNCSEPLVATRILPAQPQRVSRLLQPSMRASPTSALRWCNLHSRGARCSAPAHASRWLPPWPSCNHSTPPAASPGRPSPGAAAASWQASACCTPPTRALRCLASNLSTCRCTPRSSG